MLSFCPKVDSPDGIRLDLSRFSPWHTTLYNTLNIPIRVVTLGMLGFHLCSHCLFTLVLCQAKRTTNTHGANQLKSRRPAVGRLKRPDTRLVWTSESYFTVWAVLQDLSINSGTQGVTPCILRSTGLLSPGLMGSLKWLRFPPAF